MEPHNECFGEEKVLSTRSMDVASLSSAICIGTEALLLAAFVVVEAPGICMRVSFSAWGTMELPVCSRLASCVISSKASLVAARTCN